MFLAATFYILLRLALTRSSAFAALPTLLALSTAITALVSQFMSGAKLQQ
jgi:hypothetical protein